MNAGFRVVSTGGQEGPYLAGVAHVGGLCPTEVYTTTEDSREQALRGLAGILHDLHAEAVRLADAAKPEPSP